MSFSATLDHLPSFVIVQNVRDKSKPKSTQRRNMKYFDTLRYQADLTSFAWTWNE